MRKNMSEVVADYGLTAAHSIYLVALNLQDGQTLMNLSKFLDLDPANTNRVVKILLEKKLVYSDRKSPRSKKYSIFLTEEGRALSDKIMDNITASNNGYFRNIPREDVLHMRNTLIKVLNNMDMDIDSYMGSKHENPFYTHLQVLPLDNDYPSEPRRLTNRK